MAINWITAFKLIPWGDVVQAAPGVVRGAKELWSRTKKNAKKVADQGGKHPVIGESEQLMQRLGQLESEQVEATALINTLAEQNAQLVAALEVLRVRTRALFAFCILLALGGLALFLR